ncbi:uncharacterized protein LOC105698876 [Orussus abietinus]|uniref:uncharacterized protein LOC105698876 n=1 Tax=Orussus abietinus TaxID=222816 RepID=UPI0006258CF5|nr:uncharacterized protein LOC105698876 [Orussus abietinus]
MRPFCNLSVLVTIIYLSSTFSVNETKENPTSYTEWEQLFNDLRSSISTGNNNVDKQVNDKFQRLYEFVQANFQQCQRKEDAPFQSRALIAEENPTSSIDPTNSSIHSSRGYFLPSRSSNIAKSCVLRLVRLDPETACRTASLLNQISNLLPKMQELGKRRSSPWQEYVFRFLVTLRSWSSNTAVGLLTALVQGFKAVLADPESAYIKKKFSEADFQQGNAQECVLYLLKQNYDACTVVEKIETLTLLLSLKCAHERDTDTLGLIIYSIRIPEIGLNLVRILEAILCSVSKKVKNTHAAFLPIFRKVYRENSKDLVEGRSGTDGVSKNESEIVVTLLESRTKETAVRSQNFDDTFDEEELRLISEIHGRSPRSLQRYGRNLEGSKALDLDSKERVEEERKSDVGLEEGRIAETLINDGDLQGSTESSQEPGKNSEPGRDSSLSKNGTSDSKRRSRAVDSKESKGTAKDTSMGVVRYVDGPTVGENFQRSIKKRSYESKKPRQRRQDLREGLDYEDKELRHLVKRDFVDQQFDNETLQNEVASRRYDDLFLNVEHPNGRQCALRLMDSHEDVCTLVKGLTLLMNGLKQLQREFQNGNHRLISDVYLYLDRSYTVTKLLIRAGSTVNGIIRDFQAAKRRPLPDNNVNSYYYPYCSDLRKKRYTSVHNLGQSREPFFVSKDPTTCALSLLTLEIDVCSIVEELKELNVLLALRCTNWATSTRDTIQLRYDSLTLDTFLDVVINSVSRSIERLPTPLQGIYRRTAYRISRRRNLSLRRMEELGRRQHLDEAAEVRRSFYEKAKDDIVDPAYFEDDAKDESVQKLMSNIDEVAARIGLENQKSYENVGTIDSEKGRIVASSRRNEFNAVNDVVVARTELNNKESASKPDEKEIIQKVGRNKFVG